MIRMPHMKTNLPCLMQRLLIWIALGSVLGLPRMTLNGQEYQPIDRRIPPAGIQLKPEDETRLSSQLEAATRRLSELSSRVERAEENLADVEVLLKAVRFALLHGEFYRAQDVLAAQWALDLANERMSFLQRGARPWETQRGRVVRGFRSQVDRSVQPYGLEIPQDLSWEQPVPLYVWLHGRGDKTTDLHFLHQRQHRAGTLSLPDAIVLHPFGRQCIGYKSAGETDVMEAIDHVRQAYPIDSSRIVLVGFSMGGAGAWHLGAHYADRWVAVSPGAGFAETALYNRLTPERYPPEYEQKLWGLYDVPNYVRNLFNLPIVAYSGENDKQIQAARVMEAAFEQEGRKLTHLIGPGMGHKYHPDTLKELLQLLKQARDKGTDLSPQQIHLQTRTLRYSSLRGVQLERLAQHWQETRLDLTRAGNTVQVTTRNVMQFSLDPARFPELESIQIDQQTVAWERSGLPRFQRVNGIWQPRTGADKELAKRPGLQGPIDDAFLEPFLVVTPSREIQDERLRRWVTFELNHLRARWRALFRGDLPEKRADQITPDDLRRFHLILWGDPASNSWIARVTDPNTPNAVPLQWGHANLELSGVEYPIQDHVPVLIYPNPLVGDRYVVINSGPTFREAHDRTNSLQNPKLPDWAILSLDTPPSDTVAGRVVAADFFDESWQLRKAAATSR